LDTYRDAKGVLYYDVAVRNLDGAGPYDRDVAFRGAPRHPVGARTTLIRAQLANTGKAGEGIFASDVYRLSATVDGSGWSVHLPYEVRAVEARDVLTAPVYATAEAGAAEKATVTITATSESDPSETATIKVPLRIGDLDVTFGDARALVDGYRADAELTHHQSVRMKTQLRIAEHAAPQVAQRALDHFEAE